MEYQKIKLSTVPETDGEETNVVNIHDRKIGEVFGFGGAFTDASAYNYGQLSGAGKRAFCEKLFGKDGCAYTFCRIPLGSCDFSRNPYSESYREDLSDFSIENDLEYMVPMIRDAVACAGDNLFLFASPWSPPAFMKDNGKLNEGGRLLPKYYGTYAEYFVKFIRAYAAEGIRISGVTVQNEAKATQTWESCVFTAEEEAIFATDYLRPALDRAGLSGVKIFVWDHNRERISERADVTYAYPGAQDAIAGMAFHWYSGAYFDELDLFRQDHPGKDLFATEFCYWNKRDPKTRAAGYADEYLNCLRHGVGGLCDWNLLLDKETGGPYHWRVGGCTSILYYDAETGELTEDPFCEAVQAISGSLERGDAILATSFGNDAILPAAVRKKDGSVLLFVRNRGEKDLPVHVRISGRAATFTATADSLTVATIR